MCRKFNRLFAMVAGFLLLTWQQAQSQLAPAEDFFNSGAQLYISNNIPAALARVEMGLKNHPDDDKLKKLEQLLKQQQQQQNQQNQQQQPQDNQQKQDQKNQQQNQSQQQQQNQQNKSDPQKQDAQKQPDQKQDSDDKQKDEQEQHPAKPLKLGEMTPEQARQLLDAQKGKEQLLQFKPDGKPRNPNRPIRDW
jgi:Ca-activated chloride channel family protein